MNFLNWYSNDWRFSSIDFFGIHFWLFGLLATWTLVWKGIGMWKAARNDDRGWFIVFLLINFLGILEILYIYWISKGKK